MPKVNVKNQSKLSPQETFSLVKQMIQDDKDLRMLDPNYTCSFDENKLVGTAKGKKFTAQIAITPNAQPESCDVAIEIDLPLLLSPIKGVVEKALNDKMKKALG